MSHLFKTPTLPGFTATELIDKKVRPEDTEKTAENAVEPENIEFEVISNLGRMPRPWILWDLIRTKRDTI
jgi:hypothetical protein